MTSISLLIAPVAPEPQKITQVVGARRRPRDG